MRYILFFVSAMSLGLLSACGPSPVIDPDTRATAIVVQKKERKLFLFHNQDIIKTYNIGLGNVPVGDKKIEGDGKTPEGRYYIDRKNPRSEFYLSLGISYPNDVDRAEAAALGKRPGGDIFIHGESKTPQWFKRDWTAGCIAVKNSEIREIYGLVDLRTPIFIQP